MILLAFAFIALRCNSEMINNLNVTSASNVTFNVTELHHGKSIYKMVPKATLLDIEGNEAEAGTNAAKTRFKRQQSSGAGKFTEAAQMPQLKALRLYLQMFKNVWASSYVGGAHPFHHNVPKPVVQLFKQRIVEFFFPDVGEETVKV